MGWNNNGGGNRQAPAPIIPTAFDDRNYVLYAEGKVDGGQSVPSMKFSVAKNQPRITVYTGRKIGQDQKSESLWARMSPYAYYNFLALLEMVARGPNDVRYAQKNDTMIPDKQNPGKKKQITETQTWVGKDDQGVVWVAVTKYNAPNIQFQFKPPRFHDILTSDGKSMPLAQVSMLCALEFIRLHRALLTSVLAVSFDGESQSVPQKGGNNNWQGNRNGGGNDRNNGNNNSGNSWKGNNNNSGGNNNWKNNKPANDATAGWGQPNNHSANDDDDDDDDDAAPAFQGLPL